MGKSIKYYQLTDTDYNATSYLLIYANTVNLKEEPIDISKEVARELSSIRKERRSLKLSQIMMTIIDKYPDDSLIGGIDVLMNPNYQIDVIGMLMDINKRKRIRMSWPGEIDGEFLTYAEEGYRDYKKYEIKKYDIICII